MHVLDRKPPPAEVASFQDIDLTDAVAIAGAVHRIGGSIDALFNCVGFAGPPAVSELVTMLVNFAGVRHLTELVAERMPEGAAVATITSTAGLGWQKRREQWLELLATDGFAAARAWCDSHPDAIATGYKPSKEVATAWTMYACNDLGARGIRINCTCRPDRDADAAEFQAVDRRLPRLDADPAGAVPDAARAGASAPLPEQPRRSGDHRHRACC